MPESVLSKAAAANAKIPPFFGEVVGDAVVGELSRCLGCQLFEETREPSVEAVCLLGEEVIMEGGDSGRSEVTVWVLFSSDWPLVLAAAVLVLLVDLLGRELCEAAAIYEHEKQKVSGQVVWDVWEG